MTYVQYRIWDEYNLRYITPEYISCIILDYVRPNKAKEIITKLYEKSMNFTDKEICIEKCEEVIEIIDANKI